MLSKIDKNTTTYKLEQDECKCWFSDVFNYETHIVPHKFTLAVSPVGSGKTKWIDKFIQDSTDSNQRVSVLLIENRKIRVGQTLEDS